ncbi:MAG: V-type ATPase 116kDa subunit family protein [Chlamydiota bacterium]
MIIPTEKYVIIGLKTDLDSFFRDAQKKGCLEFVPRKTSPKSPLSTEATLLYKALRALRSRGYNADGTGGELAPLVVAKALCEAEESYVQLLEKKRLLEAEASRIRPFGDFDQEKIADLEQTTHRFVQFYSRKAQKQEKTPPAELIYLATDHDLDYFFGLHREKRAYEGYIEMVIEKPLGLILCDLKDVETEIAQIEHLFTEYAEYRSLMEEALVGKLNEDHLVQAASLSNAELEQKLFSVEAYVPKSRVHALEELQRSYAVYIEKVLFEEGETAPTYMENRGSERIGEDLVQIYDTPSTHDRDPSFWVFWFFSFFYAVIIADAGYGLLYFLLALYLKYRFPNWKEGKKRAQNLLLTISCFSIGWGVLVGSYFGINLSPEHPLKKISFVQFLAKKKARYHIDKKDTVYQEWVQRYPQLEGSVSPKEWFLEGKNVIQGKVHYKLLQEFTNAILIEISLLIGIIHLTLSFLRNLHANPGGLGWMIAMLGGYLYFPPFLGAVSMVQFSGEIPGISFPFLGSALLYGGIGLAFLIAMYKERFAGLLELANVIQVFADILSYLRLYALALAGMIMADTFNQIGMEFTPWIGWFIILLGHSVNLVLGVMGGVIHGLRLNFLEWYHYSFTGGGKAFNPLRLLQK